MRLNNDTDTCETRQTQMIALLDNELPPNEAADLRSHFALCPTCAPIFEQTQKALRSADAWKVEGTDIWNILEKRISPDLEYAAERDLYEAKAKAERVSFIDLTKHKPELSAIAVLPAYFAHKYQALPIKKDTNKLWVAMRNPQDVAAVDAIRFATRCQIAPLLAVPSDLEKAITEAYPIATINHFTETTQTTKAIEPVEPVEQDDLRAVLTEMRTLRAEIQELRSEVGTLRRLLSATQNVKPVAPRRPLSPAPMMPLALPENTGIGLL
jgi:hypothetical protein